MKNMKNMTRKHDPNRGKDFALLFDQWLDARQLGDALEPDRYEDGWKVYRRSLEPVLKRELF